MPELKRAIRLRHATAMVIGTIIGASIFVQPAEVTSEVHSVAGVLLVWLLAGAITLVGSLVCAELASAFTRTGGVYVYLTETVHPLLGFLWGWAMLLVMHSGIIAAIATVFARFAGYFLPLGHWGERGIAIAVILGLSAINYAGVRQGSLVQAWFTWVKLGAVALIIVIGVVLGHRVPDHFVPAVRPGGDTAGDVLSALAAALFAYGGWHIVTYSAEETVDPARTIPRALVWGTIIVTVTYLAMNAVYLWVLPLDEVAASSRVAADFADRLLGRGGGTLMSGLVMFSAIGGLAGTILGGPRVYFAMARAGQLFGWLGAVHPRFGTPHRAILVQAAWASALVATGSFRALFTRVIYTEWFFFALVAIGLLRLRRRPIAGAAPAWRMRGVPLLPVAFALVAVAVALNAVRRSPLDSTAGLALVLAGVPAYYAWQRQRRRPPEVAP